MAVDPDIPRLEQRVKILTQALHDIERVAEDYMDLDRHDLSSILYVCQKRSVCEAMDLSRNPT